MKIIQVIKSFQLGGANEVGVNLAIGLANKGHESCVVAITNPSRKSDVGEEMKARLSKHNIEYHELGLTNSCSNILNCSFRLIRFFRKWRPIIVHAHSDGPSFMVSIASRFSKIKVARTIHGPNLWPTHPWAGWISESGYCDDLVIFVSDVARDGYNRLREKYRFTKSINNLNIQNGVPLLSEISLLNNSDLVKQIRAEKKRYLFCFAGRFTPQKGFDLLLDALEKMPDTHREKIKIYAFGDGVDRELCAKRVIKNHLPIIIHPPIASVCRIFPEFDAVIMPSRFEGFALVSLEAFSNGSLVIGTNAPGLSETYPPDWPLTVPVENPGALSDLIIKFIEGGFDTKKLKEVARNWGKQFTINQMTDAYEKAYENYISYRENHQEA